MTLPIIKKPKSDRVHELVFRLTNWELLKLWRPLVREISRLEKATSPFGRQIAAFRYLLRGFRAEREARDELRAALEREGRLVEMTRDQAEEIVQLKRQLELLRANVAKDSDMSYRTTDP